MDGPDEIIHQPIRLRVMAALTALDPGEDGLDFTRLKGMTGATDGNLGAHLDHLARAGYVEVTKAFVARIERGQRRHDAKADRLMDDFVRPVHRLRPAASRGRRG